MAEQVVDGDRLPLEAKFEWDVVRGGVGELDLPLLGELHSGEGDEALGA